MTDRKLMKQVMENICGAKLCEINSMSSRQEMLRLLDKAIDDLGDRLAQPEQEPAAWYDKHGMVTHDPFEGIRPLYAAPRPWVGLTDEEVTELSAFVYAGDPQYVRLIETKLKEKNT